MVEEASSQQLLALTASWTAAVRAGESAREDRLFDDPWAAALAGDEGPAWLAQRSPEAVLPIVLRTRYFDDFLLGMAKEDAIRQVVIMAAGLDTRAYRIEWPAGMRLFEVDQPAVLERKQKMLDAAGATPTCERVVVPADLTGGWQAALAAAGLDAAQPALWLLEGFLFYLPAEELLPLLAKTLDGASGGSYIGFDVINGATLTSPLTAPWVEMQAENGAPWVGALDDPKTLLKRRGWKAEVVQCGSPAVSYGRWPFPAPDEDPTAPHLWLVTARRPWRIGDGDGATPQGTTPGPGIPGGIPQVEMPRRPGPPARPGA